MKARNKGFVFFCGPAGSGLEQSSRTGYTQQGTRSTPRDPCNYTVAPEDIVLTCAPIAFLVLNFASVIQNNQRRRCTWLLLARAQAVLPVPQSINEQQTKAISHIYIYIYIHACVHIRINMHVYIHVGTCMHTCMHAFLYINKYIYIYMCGEKDVHTHTHIYIYISSS